MEESKIPWWAPNPELISESGMGVPNRHFMKHREEKCQLIERRRMPFVVCDAYNLNQSGNYPLRVLHERPDAIIVLINRACDRSRYYYCRLVDGIIRHDCGGLSARRGEVLGGINHLINNIINNVQQERFGEPLSKNLTKGAVTIPQIIEVIKSAGVMRVTGGNLGKPTLDFVCHADKDTLKRARTALNLLSPRAQYIKLFTEELDSQFQLEVPI